METEKDIFKTIGKVSYGVPEGYFDDLRSRLGSIPSEKAVPGGFFVHARPYLALAACFVAALIVGNVLLRNTASLKPSSEQYLSEDSFSELVFYPMTEDYYQDPEFGQPQIEEFSDDDIIDYLIETGTQVELIAYAGNQ